MKKLFNKLIRKPETPDSSRITSDTLSQHREIILAGGRKFKYPIQYAKHKLVINTILISIAAIIVATVVGWWQLYPEQNTSEFMYRVTRVLPLPVAVVDGQSVLYGDYLMKYRSSVHYLEQIGQIDLKTDDGKRQVEYIKQQSLHDAVVDAYAFKLAKAANLSVSDLEVEAFLKSQRQSGDGERSTQTYDTVLADFYGWSQDEYRYVIKVKLLRQKVAYEVDAKANAAVENTTDILKNDSVISFKALSESVSSQSGVKANYAAPGWVSKDNQDGGLSVEAAKLTKGQVSSVVKPTSGSGYYFIKLLDINDSQVSYEYVQIPLTTFDENAKNIVSSDKVKPYISVQLL